MVWIRLGQRTSVPVHTQMTRSLTRLHKPARSAPPRAAAGSRAEGLVDAGAQIDLERMNPNVDTCF